MRPFKYEKAKNATSAAKAVADSASAEFLSGGTNIVDLMKADVARPAKLVDINGLQLSRIESKSGSISIGALATNKDTANHQLIREHFPLLTKAILAGASAQIRNVATAGRNLNQRTRCM